MSESEWDKKRYAPGPGEPELPPQLSELAQKSTDEFMKDLNRLPLFMTQLDETDGQGGDNLELEALKALAYDGEPDEIATNFKNQGNDCYKAKQYKNAIEYYTKGLAIECGVTSIELSLYLNRAACNLELKNFGRCILDCKAALQIDEKNVKACYRAGRAYFAVDKYDEAKGVLGYGLSIDPENVSIKAVLKSVEDKVEAILQKEIRKKREEEERQMKQTILVNALNLRHITIINTPKPAELLKDAKIRLEDPKDYESQLIFPAMVLYPTTDEFDFIAEISELTTPNEILEQVLDRPQAWFEDPKHKDFTQKQLLCFAETEAGGLVKVGKKVAINQALMSDKPRIPLFDNSLRLYVVPKSVSTQWLSTWNKAAALSKRSP